jgi:hypothetical protein
MWSLLGIFLMIFSLIWGWYLILFVDFQLFGSRLGSENKNCKEDEQDDGESFGTNIE